MFINNEEKERVREIVERFHCSNEVAKRSYITYVSQRDLNKKEFSIGFSIGLQPRIFNIIEEYRFSFRDAAERKGYILIKKYMKDGYEVVGDNLDVPEGKYWEFDLDYLING